MCLHKRKKNEEIWKVAKKQKRKREKARDEAIELQVKFSSQL